jgi:uncharacterized protein
MLCLLAVVVWIGCDVTAASALDVPPPPRGRVLDQADLMSGGARADLERQILEFERQTSNQIAVGIFESLEGESLEDFTIRLAEKWQPGQADRDNGVILAIFLKDRKVRIEVGYGLEGALPDALASRIIRGVLAPEFRAGRYDQGITRSVQAIMAATQGEYEAIPAADGGGKRSGSRIGSLLFLGFIIFMLSGLGRRHRGFGGRGILAGYLLGSILGGGGRGRGGFGGGGGGFGGGFGGGGFGGGGASGGW